MAEHCLVRNPKNFRVKGGTAIGCRCGAIMPTRDPVVGLRMFDAHRKQAAKDEAQRARADEALREEAWL